MQHQMLHVQVINRATRHNWRPHGVCISYGPRCSTLSFQSIGSSWIKLSALVASLTLRERRRVRLACSEARNVALQEELLKHGISFEDLDRPPHDPLLYPASRICWQVMCYFPSSRMNQISYFFELWIISQNMLNHPFPNCHNYGVSILVTYKNILFESSTERFWSFWSQTSLQGLALLQGLRFSPQRPCPQRRLPSRSRRGRGTGCAPLGAGCAGCKGGLEGAEVEVSVSGCGFVWKWLVPLHPMVLLIIIPTKWLFHWGYTPFSDIPMWISMIFLDEHINIFVRGFSPR